MPIDVYHTHIEVYPYKQGDYPIIEAMYTAQDHHTGLPVPCGYLIDNGKLYLPRGTPVSKLEHLLEIPATYLTESDPIIPMAKHHAPYFDPRNNVQERAIKFLLGPEHQKGLNLKTGVGKTYCVANASSQMRVRTLIICPNTGLKNQWMNTYNKMFGYRSDMLIDIVGSSTIEALLNGSVPSGEVYFTTHATLRNYISETNGWVFHQFMMKMGFGIKVYDEAHMDFASTLMIDMFSNTDQTWYLTATFSRSDKFEAKCFRRAFQSVISFGEQESEEIVKKHVIYHVVQINSRCDPYNRAKLMSYPGFSAIKYGRYAFFYDKNKTAYRAILKTLDLLKKEEGKILIFVPLIEAVDNVAADLAKDVEGKSIGRYHSKMGKEDKEAELNKDIIVSTIKSCGTGRDIPGLRAVISCEPIASKVVAEQMIGRLRPYKEGMDTYFFDVVSTDITPCNWWWKGRFKKIANLVKQTVYLQL